MEFRCVWTVRGLRTSSLAIWALVIPSATNPSTSTSRDVSPAGCSGAEGGDGRAVVVEEVAAEGSSSERAYSTASSRDIAQPSVSASSHATSPSRERAALRYGSRQASSSG